ncbi:MAG: hypothetical protein V4502_03130 [Pseudomonadota bacterium]
MIDDKVVRERSSSSQAVESVIVREKFLALDSRSRKRPSATYPQVNWADSGGE